MKEWIVDDPIGFDGLRRKKLDPGDTVYFRGGYYKLIRNENFVRWVGKDRNQIVVRPYKNEEVIIDGFIVTRGEHQIWDGFEFTSTGWLTRVSEIPGSHYTGLGAEGINIDTNHITILNSVFHDCVQGIRALDANYFRVENCLFFNNGWSADDRGHGHDIYWAGENAIIKNNVFAQGFSKWGFHAYAEGATVINNLKASRNVGINNILLARAINQPMNNIVMKENELWHREIEIGWTKHPNTNVVVKNNHIAKGRLILRNCIDPITEGNILAIDGANRVKIIPSGKRWLVIIYNKKRLPVVRVNLHKYGLKKGIIYKARNAQDYYRDCFCFAHGNGNSEDRWTVEFPMINHSVAVPYKHDESILKSSFPEFGCFILEEAGRIHYTNLNNSVRNQRKHIKAPWIE